MSKIADFAVAFEARWSYAALARVDRELGNRFEEQRHLYWEAMQSGDASEIETHGAALVRAYKVITQAMEAEPDSAYFMGRCPRTGFTVAVGKGTAPATRLDGVVYLTADEVATLLAEQPGFSDIAHIKTLFPGATIEACRQDAAYEEVPF